MSLEDRNRLTIVKFYKALQEGDGETMLGFYDEDVEQTEYPNQLKPNGDHRDLAKMTADFARSRGILESQRYTIKTLVCAGDDVVVEALWEGVLAIAIGKLQPGDTMRANICNMFTLHDGRIISQRNYDCFEAFS